jgi:DnaJ family protein C protein 28
MDFDRVIEKLIRKAQEEGKFNNLRGHGKPLNLDENPFEDPAASLANQMLKDHGFRPEWLEEDLSLRQELSEARRALVRARDWRADQLAALGSRQDGPAIQQRELVAYEWRLAQERFRRKLAELNKVIFTLNLKVPNTRFQRLKLNVEEELQRLIDGGPADPAPET